MVNEHVEDPDGSEQVEEGHMRAEEEGAGGDDSKVEDRLDRVEIDALESYRRGELMVHLVHMRVKFGVVQRPVHVEEVDLGADCADNEPEQGLFYAWQLWSKRAALTHHGAE